MNIFSHLFVEKIVMCVVFEKDENKRKRGRGWPILKKRKYTVLSKMTTVNYDLLVLSALIDL